MVQGRSVKSEPVKKESLHGIRNTMIIVRFEGALISLLELIVNYDRQQLPITLRSRTNQQNNNEHLRLRSDPPCLLSHSRGRHGSNFLDHS